MSANFYVRRLLPAAAAGLLFLGTIPFVMAQPAPSRSLGDQTIPPNAPAGEEVEPLEAGPIHEAFAEPLPLGEQQRIVVAKEPPAPLDEIPPDYRPEGENVEWIPGYWAWLDENRDFIWVSGVWRTVPPGRFWTPGHWTEAAEGFLWVTGYWSDAEQQVAEYLPVPPATLEQGPSAPAPSDNHFWVPGCWRWQGNDYAWRPGYWHPGHSNWLWMPDHYAYTPRGAVFVPGYWDYPMQSRGILYAPVYWPGGYRPSANYSYTPRRIVNTALVLSSLFIDSNRGSYYYGRGYGNRDGYLPWYSGYQSGFYSPLYSYYSSQYGRNSDALRQRFNNENGSGNRGPNQEGAETRGNSPLIISVDQIQRGEGEKGATGNNSLGVRQLDDNEREAIRRRVQQVDQYRSARAQFEAQRQQNDRPRGAEAAEGEARRPEGDRSSEERNPSTEVGRNTAGAPQEAAQPQQRPARFELESTPGAQELRRNAQQRWQRGQQLPEGQPAESQQGGRRGQESPQQSGGDPRSLPAVGTPDNVGEGQPPARNFERPPRRPQAAPQRTPQQEQPTGGRGRGRESAAPAPGRDGAGNPGPARGNAENSGGQDRGRSNVGNSGGQDRGRGNAGGSNQGGASKNRGGGKR